MYSSASGVCTLLSSTRRAISRVGSSGATVLGVSSCVKGKSCASRTPAASIATSANRKLNPATLIRLTAIHRSETVPPYMQLVRHWQCRSRAHLTCRSFRLAKVIQAHGRAIHHHFTVAPHLRQLRAAPFRQPILRRTRRHLHRQNQRGRSSRRNRHINRSGPALLLPVTLNLSQRRFVTAHTHVTPSTIAGRIESAHPCSATYPSRSRP